MSSLYCALSLSFWLIYGQWSMFRKAKLSLCDVIVFKKRSTGERMFIFCGWGFYFHHSLSTKALGSILSWSCAKSFWISYDRKHFESILRQERTLTNNNFIIFLNIIGRKHSKALKSFLYTLNAYILSPLDLFLKMMTSQRESSVSFEHTPLGINKPKRKGKSTMETTRCICFIYYV